MWRICNDVLKQTNSWNFYRLYFVSTYKLLLATVKQLNRRSRIRFCRPVFSICLSAARSEPLTQLGSVWFSREPSTMCPSCITLKYYGCTMGRILLLQPSKTLRLKADLTQIKPICNVAPPCFTFHRMWPLTYLSCTTWPW